MGNRAEEGGLSPPPPRRNNSAQQLGPVPLTATKVPLSPGPYNSPPGTPAGPPWAEHSHPVCGSQGQPGVTVATSLQPEERPALERGVKIQKKCSSTLTTRKASKACFLLIKKNLEVIPQLCLQVMSPAAPIYHPWRFFYTLM